MGELEQRLSEGLQGVAARSPGPGDLAAGARTRRRCRQGRTAAVVAATLAVVAVPVGIALTAGDDEGPPDRRDPAVVDSVPGDWRVETYRDLTLRVPPEWTWGGGADWCTSGKPVEETAPQVSRPGGIIPAIACSPGLGHGAHFGGPGSGPLPPGTEGVVQQYTGERYPDGAWIGYVSTRQASLWVVTDSRVLTRQVLDSAEPVRGVDGNGCAVRVPEVAPSADERVSVCRYDSGRLEQSERLSAADSAAAVEAVRSAGRATAARPACPPYSLRQPVVTLRSVDLDARLLPSETCSLSSVFLTGDGEERLVTEDVLLWALSPGWSGPLQRELPAPDRLRDG